MKCLHCGQCCIEYAVVILIDGNKSPEDEHNLECREGGSPCRHLIGDTPGHYSCAIHDSKYYKETPCFAHGQIERDPNTPCRMGEYILEKSNE